MSHFDSKRKKNINKYQILSIFRLQSEHHNFVSQPLRVKIALLHQAGRFDICPNASRLNQNAFAEI
ncbi:hypothetical protein WH96_13435 [Kiloniella spongiae]|uniref:Uncharacterized protein n=1 Tax=Kiloniella spongiae TaxID=1489064 RepID=A0A0H2MCV2_9PROT|nr:hypothetical protein WH96_13435 [Kiloniella spongiae]